MAKKTFKLNEKIIIELNNGGKIIESEFVQDFHDGIVVKNSRDLYTGKVHKFNQTYYLSEIKSIKSSETGGSGAEPERESLREEPKPSNQNNNRPNSSEQNFQRLPVIHTEKKTFSEWDIENIQTKSKGVIYISQYDDKYHNAIIDMKQQKIIAVNSEGNFGRLDIKRPLLAVATTNQLYLFDMLRLCRMEKKLKEIFSSDSPRKIIHSSAEIADYLLHVENCQLNNAFDTLMVHFSLKQTRERISLQECFTVYFNLPDDFPLQNFNFHIRPLQPEMMIRSAMNVLLLVELYWHLNDILMKPLRTATQQFLETYSNVENQVDLMTHMNNGIYPGAENIDINAAIDMQNMFEHLHTNDES